jgi:hypothetical protein
MPYGLLGYEKPRSAPRSFPRLTRQRSWRHPHFASPKNAAHFFIRAVKTSYTAGTALVKTNVFKLKPANLSFSEVALNA